MHMHIPVATLHEGILCYTLVINARGKKIPLLLHDITFPLVTETHPPRLIHLCWHKIEPALQKEVSGARISLRVKPHMTIATRSAKDKTAADGILQADARELCLLS